MSRDSLVVGWSSSQVVGEVQSEAYLALDRKHISEQAFQAIYDKATETKKLINAFIGYLNK